MRKTTNLLVHFWIKCFFVRNDCKLNKLTDIYWYQIYIKHLIYSGITKLNIRQNPTYIVE